MEGYDAGYKPSLRLVVLNTYVWSMHFSILISPTIAPRHCGCGLCSLFVYIHLPAYAPAQGFITPICFIVSDIVLYTISAAFFPTCYSSFRVGSSYDERRFIDDRYPRNACPRDILERDNYPPPPSDVGFWHNSRKRNYEEEYPFERASRRRDSYNDIGACQEYDKFRDGYHAADNNHDHGVDRSARFGDRDRDDYGHDDYVHRTRTSYQHREDSRERDYGYGRHSYDSDYDRSSKRDGNLRKRDYRDHEHDKRSSNREKGQSPQGRYGHSQSRSRSRSRSRSWSCEHDNHLRSRSPRGRSRSHREDSFDDGRYGRRGDRDEKRQREYYAVVY